MLRYLFGQKFTITTDNEIAEFDFTNVPSCEEEFVQKSIKNSKFFLVDVDDYPVSLDGPDSKLLFKKLKQNENVKYINRDDNSHKVLRKLEKDNNILSCNVLPSDFRNHSHVIVYTNKTAKDFYENKNKEPPMRYLNTV
jgi:hypothetical protein